MDDCAKLQPFLHIFVYYSIIGFVISKINISYIFYYYYFYM